MSYLSKDGANLMARNEYDSGGSIMAGIIWMLVLQILLFWLPFFGALVAGVVGGRAAGGVGAALMAVFLPAVVMGVGVFFLATVLAAIPIVGIVFGSVLAFGVVAVVLAQVGPLLLGAIIGGIMAD
ncbi:MAG: hypothetical protein HOI95_11525 [Chromatiales bacterium]|nr:hypothetical protein [Chromatiales bacterium]